VRKYGSQFPVTILGSPSRFDGGRRRRTLFDISRRRRPSADRELADYDVLTGCPTAAVPRPGRTVLAVPSARAARRLSSSTSTISSGSTIRLGTASGTNSCAPSPAAGSLLRRYDTLAGRRRRIRDRDAGINAAGRREVARR
jgi:hypothetical protein